MSEQPTSPAEPSPVAAAPAETLTSDPTLDQAPGTMADAPPPQTPRDTNAPQEPPTDPPATTEPVPPTEGAPDARVVPSAEEYVLPDGLQGGDMLRQFAATNDMTQAQLDSTLKEFGGYVQATKNAEAQALRTLGEAHVKNWGDNAQYNLTLAKRALQQNDPDGALGKALNDSGWGNHPAVLDFLYTLGSSMKEGGFLKSTVRKAPGQKTAAEAMYGDNHPVDG